MTTGQPLENRRSLFARLERERLRPPRNQRRTNMSAESRMSMPLGEAIFSQRAIRRLKPDPIPESDLRDILEAATRAPSGGNSQPWHFVVVRDAGLREQFGPLYREAWWAKRRDSGFLTPEDLPPEYKQAAKLADIIAEAPVLVLLCATAKGPGPTGSVIPAAQNLLLAARALGIGGTITTLHPVVEERVHALFRIPDAAHIVYCLPLGYPQGRFGPAQRKPLSEVCSWDHWGNAFG
ncbi:MAG: nitroreductase family protein [SAR202 cluster bacterium]|nr:nitroreductase family protein [SAR202 cluster bacterium]HAL49002.1 nitroreductase [Dehalococcoidia bacterium]